MGHYFESGLFVREKAWHGLGTVLQSAPSTRGAFRLTQVTNFFALPQPASWESGLCEERP